MPAIILQTSMKCDDEQKNQLAAQLSKICATEIGKPEDYVMSIVYDEATIFFGGKLEEAALVEIKSIGGLNPNVNASLSNNICNFLAENLGIESNKIYINFAEFLPTNWGWNGRTFG